MEFDAESDLRDRQQHHGAQDRLARGGAGGAGNGFSGGTVTAATDGTQRAFTESLLKNVAQQVYSAGGDADTLMVGAAQKQVVSTFTGNNTRTQNPARARWRRRSRSTRAISATSRS
jgi:hypothetical protein